MPVRLGRGGNVKVALSDDQPTPLQLYPKRCVFSRFHQRKRQHGIICQDTLYKTNSAFTDVCVRGAGATMQEFGCRDRSDKKQIDGVRGEKSTEAEPPPFAGDE